MLFFIFKPIQWRNHPMLLILFNLGWNHHWVVGCCSIFRNGNSHVINQQPEPHNQPEPIVNHINHRCLMRNQILSNLRNEAWAPRIISVKLRQQKIHQQCGFNGRGVPFPTHIPSMYGIVTYIWLILMVNYQVKFIPYMDPMGTNPLSAGRRVAWFGHLVRTSSKWRSRQCWW